MNAFTRKPDLSWLKKAEANRKSAEAVRRKLTEHPTPTQVKELGLLTDQRGKK